MSLNKRRKRLIERLQAKGPKGFREFVLELSVNDHPRDDVYPKFMKPFTEGVADTKDISWYPVLDKTEARPLTKPGFSLFRTKAERDIYVFEGESKRIADLIRGTTDGVMLGKPNKIKVAGATVIE